MLIGWLVASGIPALFAVAIASGSTLPVLQVDHSSVSLRASQSRVQVAEPFQITLQVIAPAGTPVVFPAASGKLGAFQILRTQDSFDIPTSADPNYRQWNRVFTLESIETGDLTIPAMQVQIGNRGDAQSLESEPVVVQVQSVLEDRADPMKFRDIHGLIDIPIVRPRSMVWLWWTVGAMAAITLAAAASVIAARRTQWQTPSQWATKKIDVLRESNLWQQSEDQSPVVVLQQLIAILRRYLSMELEIDATRWTSTELLSIVTSKHFINSEIATRLDRLFGLADQVKFAGLNPAESEIAELLNEAQSLIDQIAEGNRRGKPDSAARDIEEAA